MKLCKSTGGRTALSRALSMRVFHESFLGRLDLQNPVTIYHLPTDRSCDYLYRRVMEMVETGIPSERFGLSFKELLELDYATFLAISDKVEETIERDSKTYEKLENDAKINKNAVGNTSKKAQQKG